MRKILTPDFFERRPQIVARELLGKFLVRQLDGKTYAYMITETEAYDGERDLACHASKGRTKRTEVMFGHAGYWYVYFVYGMYDMLNVVTGPKGYPSAVLIRAANFYQDKTSIEKVSLDGPGKLTRELGITRNLNGKSADRESCLWIEDRGCEVGPRSIRRTPRIGVPYAGEWAKKPWRFILNEKAKRLPSLHRSRPRGRRIPSSRRR